MEQVNNEVLEVVEGAEEMAFDNATILKGLAITAGAVVLTVLTVKGVKKLKAKKEAGELKFPWSKNSTEKVEFIETGTKEEN